MASGLQSTSTPIEPTQVWSKEEWQQTQPWARMPRGPLRNFFKEEAFMYIYGAGPNKFRGRYQNRGTTTGRFWVNHPPMQQEGRH